MSTLGERIKYARESKGYLQSELAKLIGVKSAGVISNWEQDLNKPDAEKIVKLCEVLDVSASFLLDYYGSSSLKLDPDEIKFIESYRSLDSFSRETVNMILEREISRADHFEDPSSSKTFAYYGKIAAAGASFGFYDVIAGTKEFPLTEENRDADYTIGVSGDSMEPEYYDGDIVYVKKCEYLDIGDIGIFQKDNGIYIKEVGPDGLLSLNGNYKPMVGGGDVVCLGKVIGKAVIE